MSTALKKLMEECGIEVETTAIEKRSDNWNSEYSHTQTHYEFTVKTKHGQHQGQYSKGCADVIKLAKRKTHFAHYPFHGDRDLVLDILEGKRKLSDPKSEQWRAFMYQAAKVLHPDPVDILWSLLCDASGSDQFFEDWALELGYSDDSIKAKEVWEICNDTRRFLMLAFGEHYETAEELALEM